MKYVDGKKILFKALPSANMVFDISEIQNLTLSDGTKIFENGKILVYDLKSVEKYRYTKAAVRGSSFIITSALIIGIGLYFLSTLDWSADIDLPPPL